jgi:hypothetical protein
LRAGYPPAVKVFVHASANEKRGDKDDDDPMKGSLARMLINPHSDD